MYKSETSKVRHIVKPYLIGKGIDIGFGGDKVDKSFDGCDLPKGYAVTGNDKNDIPADITKGLPIADETYDTVYSSHLIEDFQDTRIILVEMLRILKPGGNLILVFPDEQKYKTHCINTNQPYNHHHKHADMCMDFMAILFFNFDNWDALIYEELAPYNCIIMATKTK